MNVSEWRKRIDAWDRLYQEKRTTYQQITDYYNNIFAKGLLSVNLVFSYGRAMVPQLYFKNPVVGVNIKVPDQQFRLLEMTMQRMDDELIVQTQLKQALKKAITTAYCYGRGPMKVGFMEPDSATGFLQEMPSWRRHNVLSPNRPWVQAFYPDDFAFDANVSDFEDSAWCAMRFERSREQLRGDPVLRRAVENIEDGDPDDTVKFWEVWDKHTGEWHVLTVEGPDFSTEGKPIEVWPFYVLDFNWCPRNPIPVSDAELILLLQDEYNEVKTQIHEHRRVSITKLLARKGVLDNEAKSRLESGKVGPIVEIEGVPAESVMEFKPSVPTDLYTTANTTLNDVRDCIGFTRNQLGEFAGGQGSRRTAREATIVQQAIQLRLDERRDMVADLIGQVVTAFNDMVMVRWDPETVATYAGVADGWELIEMIRGKYVVSVVPDSTLPTGRMVKQQEAKEMYVTLRGDPFIDQIKLRLRYLGAFETGSADLITNPMMNPLAAASPGMPSVPAGDAGVGANNGAMGELPGPKV